MTYSPTTKRHDDAPTSAGAVLQAANRAAKAMLKRQAEGRPAPHVPFVDAALGYDTLEPGALARKPPAQDPQQADAPGDAPRGRRGHGAVRAGYTAKEESRFAFAVGSNYLDRQHPEFGKDDE